MLQRCRNPNVKTYPYYGGRGIKVCAQWNKFENFYADMGDRPDGMAIDRIDTNGNYEPSNCRWATRREQSNNLRSNVRYTFNGESLTIPAWSRKQGMSVGALDYRLRVAKWPVEMALTIPISKNRHPR